MGYSIWGFFDTLRESGLRVEEGGSIGREYELTRIVSKMKNPIITSITGARFRAYANVLSKRELIHLALSTGSDEESYRKILDAMSRPTRGSLRSFGGFFEETDFKLSDLPFIKFYREDGGYYLTSGIFCSCIDGVCNASYHRMMLIGDNAAAIRLVPRHLHRIYMTYRQRGVDTPAAIILGVHPAIELASAASPPFGVYELYVANTILGGRLEFVETPLYKIPVPATASVVIEGVITSETVWEGPFVDILRLPDRRRQQPVFKASRVYVNRGFEPLIHAIVPGFEEHLLLMGYPREALIWDSVRRVADVKAVRLTPGGGSWLCAVVSIRKRAEGEAKNVIAAALAGHPSLKLVVVVDDDIDVDNPHDVEWAIATRFQASRDLIVIPRSRGSTLDPSGDDGVVDKVGVDATAPLGAAGDVFRRARVP